MKLSENNKYTGHLLIKANTNSDYWSVSHILVSVTEKDIENWEYRSQVCKRTHDLDEELFYTQYNTYDGQFFEMEDELILENEWWSWVELDEDEEDNLPEMELRLEGTESRYYPGGGLQFIAWGKHDGSVECSSESINVAEIKASMI